MAQKLEDNHVEISLDFLASMNEKLQECEFLYDNPPTIHRVHPDVRKEGNHDHYDPKFVSIGPYHRKIKHLQSTEQLKWRFLKDLLNRQSKPDMLEKYIDAVRKIEKEARTKYSEKIDLQEELEFVMMLVLDGCFILEVLLKHTFKTEDGANGKRPSSEVKWNPSLVKRDLLLLENQIPFSVLEALFNESHFPELDLVGLALNYISDGGKGPNLSGHQMPPSKKVFHLLHLSYLCQLNGLTSTAHDPPKTLSSTTRYLYWLLAVAFYYAISLLLMWKRPKHHSSSKTEDEKNTPRMIPSATKLRNAGVRFKKKESSCLMDVTFTDDGTLEIPFLRAEDKTFSLLRNLIAFEQYCHPATESRITAYAMFMDNIVDTPDDVEILVERNIMESKLGCSKEVARLFNVLRRGTWLDYQSHYLAKLFKRVHSYYESDQHRWRAQLVHVYFCNPWARVSSVTCASILVFTGIQAVYTIADYYRLK